MQDQRFYVILYAISLSLSLSIYIYIRHRACRGGRLMRARVPTLTFSKHISISFSGRPLQKCLLCNASLGKPRNLSLEGILPGKASECLPGKNSFRASQAVTRDFSGFARIARDDPDPLEHVFSCQGFLDRPGGRHFSDFDPILDPKMASPDRLLALFFRLPTSISEFSKKWHPSQAKSLFLLVRRLRKSLLLGFKIV